MKFLQFSLPVAAAILLAVAAPADAQKLEKIKMTAAANSINYAPYFVPIVKGYYKEEGFDVERIKAGGGTATPALLSGKVDFSTSGSAAVSAILRGAPLKVIFYPWDRLTYQVWVTKPEIKSVADLKGKAIGIISRGDTMEIGLRIMLANKNMDPGQVMFTPMGYGAGRRAAVASGSLPAVVISEIDVQRLKATGGLGKAHKIYDMSKEIKLPLTGLAVSTKAIASDRERVKRFVRAVLKGHLYTAAFKEGTVKAMRTFSPKTSAKTYGLIYDDTIRSRTQSGAITEDLQKKEVAIRSKLLKIKNVPATSKVYDFSIAREAMAELKKEGWKPTM